MWGRIRISLSLAGAALALLAPGASATDYCVVPNTSCGGTNVATLEEALGLADNAINADRIFLGAATYVAPTSAGYDYNTPDAPVDIVGAGRSATTLTGPSGGIRAIGFRATAASTISDLTVTLPENAPASSAALELLGTARRVSVTAAATQSNSPLIGVFLAAGSFQDGTVALPTTFSPSDMTGIIVAPGATGAVVARSTVTARTGVSSRADSTLERLLVTATGTGVVAGGVAGDATVDLRASVVRVTGGGGATGISAFAQPGGPAILNANGVTVVGDGSPGSTGAVAANIGFTPAATLSLRSSVIRGTERSIGRIAGMSGGGASLSASFSNYDPNAVSANTGVGTMTPPPGSLNPGANVGGDPRFANVAAGNYRLLAGSPAVDTGAPATPMGLDFDGSPWIIDGNRDGVARRDMGAFERPVAPKPPVTPAARDRRAPLIRRFRADPSRFAAARKVRRGVAVGTRFRYRLDEAAKVTITLQRALPGRRVGKRCRKPSRGNRGRRRCTRYVTRGKFAAPGKLGTNVKRFNGRLKGSALRVGRYRALIRALDKAKNRSIPRTARLRILKR